MFRQPVGSAATVCCASQEILILSVGDIRRYYEHHCAFIIRMVEIFIINTLHSLLFYIQPVWIQYLTNSLFNGKLTERCNSQLCDPPLVEFIRTFYSQYKVLSYSSQSILPSFSSKSLFYNRRCNIHWKRQMKEWKTGDVAGVHLCTLHRLHPTAISFCLVPLRACVLYTLVSQKAWQVGQTAACVAWVLKTQHWHDDRV